MADADKRVGTEGALRRSFFAVLAGFLFFFMLVGLVWVVRGLLSPVLVGFFLAYICNPVVNWAQGRWRVPRLLTASLLLLIFVAVLAAIAIWLAPLAVEQISQFVQQWPNYLDRVLRFVERGAPAEEIREQVSEAAGQPEKVLPMVLGGVRTGFGIFTTTVSMLTYMTIYVTLVVIFFVTFCSRMPDIKSWCRQFLPHTHRDEILTTVQKISDAAGVFLRTRLMIAVLVAIVLSAGWAFAGVPYWFLLGCTTALLNIIPFAAAVGWIIVLIINSLSVDSMAGLLPALLWPTVVYAVAQFLDGWVFSPWLEGDQLHIHPVVVLFAVLAGGSIAGAFGMLLGIPVAAAWQIFFGDVVKPRLMHWASSR